MADEQTEIPEPESNGATPETEALGQGGEKALAAERAARKAAEKRESELAARVKEFEDRNKSDSEKLQEQLSELTGRAAKAERENARLAVIAQNGIPADYHDLIQGDDEESLAASAAKVRQLLNAAAPVEGSFIIPDEGGSPALALNGDGIESALKKALGIA